MLAVSLMCSYEGLCYAVWLDPAKVSDVATEVMAEAGHSLPLLLANRVRALCCDRMGRKFDTIMKRMPQVLFENTLWLDHWRRIKKCMQRLLCPW